MTLGILGLLAAAILLGGCEEEDVAGVFGAANVNASKVETVELAFEAPVTLDVDTTNGEVMVRGVEGIQSVSVTVTLRSKGQTLEEAQDRVDRIVYHVEQAGNRITARYRASEQEADVRRYSGVEFDVLVPVETRVEVDTTNGAISIEDIDGTIRLDTSNGELWLEQVIGSVDAETSNGSVQYIGTPATGGNRLRTSNGSITVRVPIDASITFLAGTSTGRIRSDLPLVGDTQGDDWNAELNPPTDTTFTLQTSNGTIRIEGTGP